MEELWHRPCIPAFGLSVLRNSLLTMQNHVALGVFCHMSEEFSMSSASLSSPLTRGLSLKDSRTKSTVKEGSTISTMSRIIITKLGKRTIIRLRSATRICPAPGFLGRLTRGSRFHRRL